jgi:hypothetical protein
VKGRIKAGLACGVKPGPALGQAGGR